MITPQSGVNLIVKYIRMPHFQLWPGGGSCVRHRLPHNKLGDLPLPRRDCPGAKILLATADLKLKHTDSVAEVGLTAACSRPNSLRIDLFLVDPRSTELAIESPFFP